MKCEQAHRQIHLLGELTAPERDAVLQHISGCTACMELFRSVEKMNQTVRRAGGMVIEPADSMQLTDRIMAGIAQPVSAVFKLQEFLSGHLELRSTKWALAAASLLLIFQLAMEQIQFSSDSSKDYPARFGSNQYAVINRKIFQDELAKHRKTESFKKQDSCWDPFQAAQYSIECLKESYTFRKNTRSKS